MCFQPLIKPPPHQRTERTDPSSYQKLYMYKHYSASAHEYTLYIAFVCVIIKCNPVFYDRDSPDYERVCLYL